MIKLTKKELKTFLYAINNHEDINITVIEGKGKGLSGILWYSAWKIYDLSGSYRDIEEVPDETSVFELTFKKEN